MPTLGLECVKWPALSFAEPHSIVFKHISDRWFSELTPKQLRELKKLRSHYLIDSTGTRYHLERPAFESSLSLLARIIGRPQKVEWQIRRDGVLNVDEVRRLIAHNFEEYESTWKAQDLDTLRFLLSSAQSIDELMNVFG